MKTNNYLTNFQKAELFAKTQLGSNQKELAQEYDISIRTVQRTIDRVKHNPNLYDTARGIFDYLTLNIETKTNLKKYKSKPIKEKLGTALFLISSLQSKVNTLIRKY